MENGNKFSSWKTVYFDKTAVFDSMGITTFSLFVVSFQERATDKHQWETQKSKVFLFLKQIKTDAHKI